MDEAEIARQGIGDKAPLISTRINSGMQWPPPDPLIITLSPDLTSRAASLAAMTFMLKSFPRALFFAAPLTGTGLYCNRLPN